MAGIEAQAHLTALVGKTIWTATRRRPNRILRVTGTDVIVATEKSPGGQPVPLEWVQDAFDRLAGGEAVRISVSSLRYRSAFVGAAMLTLPNTELLAAPTRVRVKPQSVAIDR